MKKVLILILLTISIQSYSQSLQLVNVGSSPNDHTGDPLRTAFIKVNQVIDTVKYINSLLGYYATVSQLNGKQATLVSGVNIKTINSISILGAGNMVIGSGGTMVYPGTTGITTFNGSGWGASITDNSTNWNAAYGWGNHASAGYALNSALANYVPTSRTVNGHYLSVNVTIIPSDIGAVAVSDSSAMLTKYARKASPIFTGAPTAPTQTVGDNSTKIATTAFVIANGGSDAGLTVRVDSIVKVLKDSLSLSSVAVIIADSLTNQYATKKYARDNGGGGSTIPVLSANPSSGNAYINSVDKKLHYLSGGYWHRVAILDSTSATASLNTGLIDYWNLDQNSTTQTDAIGSNNLTVGGATYYSTGGILGHCLDYTHNTDYAYKTPVTLAFGSNTLSISLWVKINTLPVATTASLIAYNEHTGWTRALSVIINPDSFEFDVFNNIGGGFQVESSTIPSTGIWYNVVCVLNGANPLKIYVNGSDVSTSAYTFSGTLLATSNWFGVGCVNNSDLTAAPAAYIDEVGFWNRALTSGEVTSLYNAGVGKTYPF
jgi:hypothetical protein